MAISKYVGLKQGAFIQASNAHGCMNQSYILPSHNTTCFIAELLPKLQWTGFKVPKFQSPNSKTFCVLKSQGTKRCRAISKRSYDEDKSDWSINPFSKHKKTWAIAALKSQLCSQQGNGLFTPSDVLSQITFNWRWITPQLDYKATNAASQVLKEKNNNTFRKAACHKPPLCHQKCWEEKPNSHQGANGDFQLAHELCNLTSSWSRHPS